MPEHEDDALESKQPALNVLFFLHSTALGGAERCFLEFLTYLSSDSDVVCTAVCPENGPLVRALQALGVRIVVCAGLSWWAGKGISESSIQESLISGAQAFLELMPSLRDIDPDVIYTETIVIPWGASAAALLDKPHMWSICEYGELDHGFTFPDGLGEILPEVRDGASFILTISEAVRATLFPDLGPDRARTIYRHSATPSVEAPAEEAFHRPNALRLALFGRISEGKCQLDAVKAVSRLRQRGRDAELILAGYDAPEYKKRIEDFSAEHGLQERVRLVEFIHDPYPTMLAADALLVCSRKEAFGRVAVDGMKLGLPVTYARSGGVPEFMVDGVTGLSYTPGNVEELVQRIEELADDPARAAQIGAAAKQHAAAKFGCNGDQILRVLRDLTSGKDGKRRVSIPKHVVAAILAGCAIGAGDQGRERPAEVSGVEIGANANFRAEAS